MVKNNFDYQYLFDINSPEDLRQLPEKALPRVAVELREYLVDTIARVGGHFGAGLGVVELTVALHYIYNTPIDKLIFDTGHQGYPHKILTGRRDKLHTIRKKDGLSGFLKRSESEYDCFGAGHASTSISAALGLATARDLQGKDNKVVAIIGDGAMTGGLAYEAMNNIGVQKRNITVILNDNNASIEPNVSAFSNYFNELYASSAVQSVREGIWEMTGKMDSIGDRLRKLASRMEDGLKAIITPGVLFESLGFSYFGPINGNNLPKLLKMLRLIRDMDGPVFLHIMTKKGKGFEPAEKDSTFLHAIGQIDKLTGKSLKKKEEVPSPPSFSSVFGDAMVEICKMNPKVVGITAAMGEGTGLIKLEKAFPERFFDVGIAESHGVTFASGMAADGMIPVCAIYSSFLQRAFDNIVHDAALQNLHVVFAIDRAGLVGADGATHHGVLDLSYLRPIQNMIIMAPKDEQELRDMLYSAVYSFKSGPVAVRYPRGSGSGVPIREMQSIPLGKSEIIREGTSICVMGVGVMTLEAVKAAELLKDYGINVEVINTRFVKPLDEEMLDYVAEKFDNLITIEDGQQIGGFGSGVIEYFNSKNIKNISVEIMAIPDEFINHGSQEQLHAELGLDSAGIVQKINDLLDIEINTSEKVTVVTK